VNASRFFLSLGREGRLYGVDVFSSVVVEKRTKANRRFQQNAGSLCLGAYPLLLRCISLLIACLILRVN
jgi:hypothetical protein